MTNPCLKKKPRRFAAGGAFHFSAACSALALLHYVLGAIRGRVDVGGRAADGVAAGNSKRESGEADGDEFADHVSLLHWGSGTIMAPGRSLCPPQKSGSALTAVDRILGAVGDRIHVAGGAADGVAACNHERGADQNDSRNLLEHRSHSLM